MSARKLNVAIVGCGWVSDWHARDGLAHLPGKFSIAACCDTNPERLRSFGDRYEITRRVSSYDDVLNMDDIDVVALCTPPASHHGMVVSALKTDKHVVCEKPLTSSLALVDDIIRKERASGGRVVPVFQYRFGDGIAKVRHAIQSGLAGKAYLSTVETAKRRGKDYYEVPWRGKFASELGGVLLTQAIHSHDLLFWLMGPAAWVSAAKTTRVNPIEVEDCAVASLIMQDGSLASLAATLGSMRQLIRIRLCFENVTFELQAFDQMASTPGDVEWTVIGRDEVWQERILGKMNELGPNASGFVRQYELLHDACIGGGEMPVTLQDARRSIELVTALFDAAEGSTAVRMPIGPGHRFYTGWVPKDDAARLTSEHA